MTDDALDRVLRLVADGRLTADEAGPILDALDARPRPEADPTPAGSAGSPARGPGRAIRIEVIDQGRKVVNLRVPLALGQAAIGRIPGLSGDNADRLREAIEAGMTGQVVTVDEGTGDGVRIAIE